MKEAISYDFKKMNVTAADILRLAKSTTHDDSLLKAGAIAGLIGLATQVQDKTLARQLIDLCKEAEKEAAHS